MNQYYALFLLLILSLAEYCFGQSPTVEIFSTDPKSKRKDTLIEAISDKDVTLDCRVDNKPPETQVRWQRIQTLSSGRLVITNIAINEGGNDNTKFGVEKPTMFTWRLRIKSIHPSDAGVYICYVNQQRQSKVKDSRTIYVYTPPTFIAAQTSSDMTVREGERDLSLMCHASGTPEPTIRWKKQGGKPLPVGGVMYRGAKLEIPVVRYDHRGIYHCFASNKMGEIMRNIQLKVKFKPQVTVTKDKLHQAVGYLIELQCFIEANPYPTDNELKWVRTRPGEGVQTISVSDKDYVVHLFEGAFNRLRYELIIKNVRKSDFGKYECQVKNQEGSGSKTIKLIESDVPYKSIKLGRIVSGDASPIIVSLSTLLTCLLTVLLHNGR